MKYRDNWLDRIIFSYSYAIKMKIILFLGFTISIYMTTMLYIMQWHPSRILELKLVGLQQHRYLSDLFDELYELELLLQQQGLTGTENAEEIALVMKTFETSLNNFKTDFIKETQLAEISNVEEQQQVNYLLDKLIERWTKLKQEIQTSGDLPVQTYIALIDDILELVEYNILIHGLKLSFEMTSYLLTDAAVIHLSYNQAWIAKIIAKEWGSIKERPLSLSAMIEFKELENSLRVSVKKAKADIKAFIQEKYANGTKERFNALTVALIQYETELDRLLTMVDSFSQSLEKQSVEDSLHFLALGRNVLKYGREIKQAALDTLKYFFQSYYHLLKYREKVATSITIVAMICVIFMFMTRLLRRPLENLREAAEKLTEGNLTVRVEAISKDEVGQITQSFNEMAQFFENVMTKAKGITTQLVDHSSTLFNTVKKLETNVLLQEKEIHLIANQAKKIASTTHNFASSLKDVNKVAAATSRLAGLGASSLAEMDNIMQQMVEASKNIVLTLSTLKDHVSKINSVISTIVKIADQSNLLSLNTAIRASKTGLKGIGFSIVANKIRELADQTAYATLDIEKAVEEIVSVISGAAGEVDKFSEQILRQVDDDKHVTEKLKKLIGQTQQQLQTFDVINLGMEVQLKETLQIQDSLSHLGDITHQTTRSFKKLYDDIEFLYSSVQTLGEAIDKFRVRSQSVYAPEKVKKESSEGAQVLENHV
jgi:methyl-accepting chemotaxis protein WspA